MTYWGDGETQELECDTCGETFWLSEHVQRHYEVTKEDPEVIWKRDLDKSEKRVKEREARGEKTESRSFYPIVCQECGCSDTVFNKEPKCPYCGHIKRAIGS